MGTRTFVTPRCCFRPRHRVKVPSRRRAQTPDGTRPRWSGLRTIVPHSRPETNVLQARLGAYAVRLADSRSRSRVVSLWMTATPRSGAPISWCLDLLILEFVRARQQVVEAQPQAPGMAEEGERDQRRER